MSARFDPDALAPLLASFTENEPPLWLRDALGAGLGGVALFGYNTPSIPETVALTRALEAAAGRRIVIGIDEEGGDVTRMFAAKGGPHPSARAFGEVDEPELTARHGRAMGELLAACGITMNFAPVADVQTNAANPVIGARAFGCTAELVARHAGAFAGGLREAGVLSCAKHFPGHGDTAVDSHLGLPTVSLSRERVLGEHVAAFEALGSAVDAVMTAHVAVPALGEGPATFSRWSTELLARTNPGTLIVTDALDMGAITETVGFAEACVRAMEAGAHVLCLGTSIRRDGEQMLREAHDALAQALREGRLDREQLRARAREVRERLEALSTPSANDLARLVGALESVGFEAAERAVSLHASAPLASLAQAARGVDRARVLDARFLHDYAAGKGSSFLPAQLEVAGFAVPDSQDAQAGSAANEGGTLACVISRLGAASADELARCEEHVRAAEARGDIPVIVHAGVPESAPRVRGALGEVPVLFSFGASRASMRAIARALARAVARP